MLYDAEEIAELTGKSKVTVYRKMKLHEVTSFITVKNGKQFINEEGLNIIKSMLNIHEDEETPEEPHMKEVSSSSKEDDPSVINKELVMTLMDQLKVKDIQLEEKDKQIHELHRLIENNQVLLREKPIDIKALEEHFQDVDSKLLDLREQMKLRKEQDQKKGFFNRFIKK